MSSPATAAPVNVTAQTFMTDVVESSTRTPILVDFWAPWCAPCRQLMPVLERLSNEYAGRFKLAKVNTDEQQELAQELGIRSLPTVVLFKDGAAVDHFVGLVPEAQIRQMLDRHVPAPPRSPLDLAREHKAAGDFAAARAQIESALALEPQKIEYLAELAELRALEGDADGAKAQLQELQGREPTHAAVRRLGALLQFSETVAAHPDSKALKERVASNPQDLDALHALAVHQLLGGEHDKALESWLNMMRKHRKHGDDLARRSLLAAFELIGEADPLVTRTRREMARMMF